MRQGGSVVDLKKENVRHFKFAYLQVEPGPY